MKVDPVNNTQISFPNRREDIVFKKPDLTSDHYIPCGPTKDEFILTSTPCDPEIKKPILKIIILRPKDAH